MNLFGKHWLFGEESFPDGKIEKKIIGTINFDSAKNSHLVN